METSWQRIVSEAYPANKLTSLLSSRRLRNMVLTLSNLIRLLQKSCTRSISSRAIRPEVKSAKRSYSQNNVSSYNHARTRSAVTGATQCLQKPRVTCRSRTSSWVGSIQKDYHHGQKQAFSASNFRAARKWRPIEQLRMRHFLGVSYDSLERNGRGRSSSTFIDCLC